MKDQDKTRQQLISELEELRGRVAAWQESEARARCLMETVPLGVTECNTEGVITLVNPAYESMTRYSSDELVGMRVADLVQDGPEREALPKYFKHLVSEQPAPSPYRCKDIAKDGRLIDVQVDWAYKRNPQGQVTGFTSIISDFTDRKRTEEELAKSTAILQAAIECLPFDFFAIGADGRYLMENAVCRAHWGRLVGKTPEEMTPDEDVRKTWLDNNRRAFAGQKVEGETKVTIRSEERIVYQVITPIRDETHSYGVLGVNIDITERKRAEEALRKAHDELERRVEERTAELSAANEQLRIFQMFLEASGQGFGMADLDGYITYWNPTLCRLFGEDKPEHVVGKHVSAYYPKEYVEKRINEILPAVMRDGHWQGELLVYSRQGKATPILQNAFLIRDDKGNPVRLAAAISDITERKLAEAALQTSEQKYRQLVETTGTGYLILDGEGRVIDANAEYLRICGRHALEDALGRTVVEWTAPYDVDRNAKEVEKCYRKGLVRQLEIDYVHPDGKIVPIDINATCLDTEDGRRIVCLCRDITERRQAQAALERERRTLEHMLQASDHERQLIAYDIHDGLAQELAGAIMQFQIYEHQKDTQPQDAEKAFDGGLSLLRQAHTEARRLISGVRPPILDESGVMAAISHLVHDPAFGQGPKVEFRSRVKFSRLAPVVENVIYRIVQEGLTNARTHSRSAEIRVSLVQRSDRLRIEVRDWGVGFDPKKVQENRFGLDGIRERARLLRGKYIIRSKPGEGTAVVVELPVAEHRQEE